MQLWTIGVSSPRGVMRNAQQVEAAGWDGPGRLSKPLRRCLCCHGHGRHGYRTDWPGHRGDQFDYPAGRHSRAIIEREVLPALHA